MTSKLRLARRRWVERDVALLGRLVVDDGVALAEGAAADILAATGGPGSPRRSRVRTPDARRWPSRCPRRSRSPALACGDDALERADEPAGWPAGRSSCGRPRAASPAGTAVLAALVLDRRRVQAVPGALEPVGLVRLVATAPTSCAASSWRWKTACDRLRLAGPDDAALLERCGIDLPHRRVLRDLLVHQRLGEAPARRPRCGRGAGSRTCR